MNFKRFGRTDNLFDYATVTFKKYINASGEEATSSGTGEQSLNHSDYISVDAGMTYTFKCVKSTMESATTNAFCWFDSDKQLISRELFNADTVTSFILGTATAPINATYLIMNYRGLHSNTAMLNEGSTALPYQPYKGWTDTPHYIHNTSTDTITTLPAVIYADGNNATVGISGNTMQNGTPTPSNPVDVNGVGERTENLFNENLKQGYYSYNDGSYNWATAYVSTELIPCNENTLYTFRCVNIGGGSKNYGFVFFDSSQTRIGSDYSETQTEDNIVQRTATSPQNAAYLVINIAYGRYQDRNISPNDISDFMLNTGSTALPYEPYGYKIPISSGGVTTNIYLGSTQTVRQIKSKVIPSDYSPITATAITNGTRFELTGILGVKALSDQGLCTHAVYSRGWNTFNAFSISRTNGHIYMARTDISTVEEFREWLADQSANGTPVRVWYAIATPETATVNEPLMKIGTYADTLSNAASIPTTEGANSITVDTTVQPSEFTATWTGWHDSSVKEWDGSQWNE